MKVMQLFSSEAEMGRCGSLSQTQCAQCPGKGAPRQVKGERESLQGKAVSKDFLEGGILLGIEG